MAVTIFGRGYPMSAIYSEATCGSNSELDIYWASTQVAKISGSYLSVVALSAATVGPITNLSATSMSATTICATTTCGVNISASSLRAVTASSTNLTAVNFSGATALVTDISGTHASAGGTGWQFMSAGAGKCVCGHDVGNVGNISADAALLVIFKGYSYYIPCLSAIAKQS